MDRYRIFRRGKIWYLEHDATGKQTSLHTRDKQEAQRILNAQYEAHQNPSANLQIARIYMNVADEKYAKRTAALSHLGATPQHATGSDTLERGQWDDHLYL